MMDAAAYTDQFQQLLPPGAAWTRDGDANLTKLLGALAEEFARVDARLENLHEEADPRTALELLPDWERIVGLPDPCSGVIAATVPERRGAVVGKLTAGGGQSIAYLTALAQSYGYAVAIDEFRPLRAGFRAGDRCRADAWAYAFQVNILPLPDTPTASDVVFRAGAGRAGDRLRSFGSVAIECVIRRAKPAHTVAIFAYPAADAPAFLFDFTA